MYLNSNNAGYNLSTQSNNYGGTDLTSDWGASVKQYFTKEQYYCGGISNTKPYVIFDNLNQNIDFLIDRFSGRVSQINDLSSSEITKFIVLYSNSSISSNNVYTSMNPTDITNMESKVTKAINLFNQNTGNFTQTPPPANVPAPNPFDFVVENVGGSFNKLTVTIKPNSGLWNMILAEYNYYKVTSECGSGSGSGRRLDEFISQNMQTFTITKQDILGLEGCNINTPQKDLVGTYEYHIWIYGNPKLPDGNFDNSRQQSIWNDYTISFEIK
jgi:hypothetical protein